MSLDQYTSVVEKENRLSICKSCDQFKIDEDFTTCNKCGCSINLLITDKNEKCPLEKW